MQVPELTYQFTVPRDVASGSLTAVHRSGGITTAGTFIFVDMYVIPTDSFLALTHFSMQAIGGGAQIPTIAQLDTLMPSGQLFRIIENRFWQAGQAGFDQNRSFQWAGNVWLPGGGTNSRLRASCSFDAAVAANQILVNFFGLLIPKANIQLG